MIDSVLLRFRAGRRRRAMRDPRRGFRPRAHALGAVLRHDTGSV